ncbi:hypothetical protein ACSFXN_18405 [Planococcus sp. 1R117A]|uniref:hypothetical protein n=1 Tax=Planococcus sp. 1R117A TaxID=3447020 RepID=UPI003EDBD2F4
MKSFKLVVLILMTGLILVGCGSEKNKGSNTEVNEKEVFTEADIEKVEEMTNFLNDKMINFEAEVNIAIQNKSIEIGNNEKFSSAVRKLGQEIVIAPFLEKYPGSLIAKDSDSIPITFESTSSEPCGFGNCTYDKINILQIDYNLNMNEVYVSKEFGDSQLIFDDVQMKYKEQSEEEQESATMSFVKSENGNLIFSRNPFLHIETIDFPEYDKEFASIATDVPESEVEAEQAEYKKEVQETLAKFPELQ